MMMMIRVVKKREERMKRGRNGRREEGQMRGWVEGGVVVDIVGLIGGLLVGILR